MPVSLSAPLLPPPDRGEIFRYMRCPQPDAAVEALLTACLTEALPCISPRVAFAVFDIEMTADGVRFPFATWESRDLAEHLSGCKKALLFGATLGLGIDRLIARSSVDAAAALCTQAIGAERVEALCDAFCGEQATIWAATGFEITGRFSPGYGDWPLSAQADVFRFLDLPRRIGLTLNESYIMSPSKSVTAVLGIREKEN